MYERSRHAAPPPGPMQGIQSVHIYYVLDIYGKALGIRNI